MNEGGGLPSILSTARRDEMARVVLDSAEHWAG
jgi:hypothetical protein